MGVEDKLRPWALAGFAMAAFGAPAYAQTVHSFDIPAQSLATALETFGRQSGMAIIFDRAETAGLTSAPVRGVLPAGQALAQLLSGSGLSAREANASTFVVSPSGTPTGVRSGETSQLEELVVTAQRREEKAQKVPISMTVLGVEAVSRLQTTNEIGMVTPNVQVEQSTGFSIPRISIRGIAQGDYNGNGTTSNMVYLDDVPMNAPVAQGIPIWDLGRAEVLRGPQGTLFGRNATGGAVRYISRMPGTEWEADGEVSYGSFSLAEVRVAAGGPVTDTLGVRVSYLGHWMNGDLYNITRDERVGNQAYNGARAIVDWRPTDELSLVLRAQFFESDTQPFIWKTTPGRTTFRGFGPTPDGRSVADIQAQYGFVNYGPMTNYKVGEHDTETRSYLRHIPVSLNIDYDLGGVTLTSVTGFLDIRDHFFTDSDGTSAPILNSHVQHYDRQWTQEIRFASDNDSPFQWIAGAFYIWEKMKVNGYYQSTAWRGEVVHPTARTLLYQRGVKQYMSSYAAFLHTTYDFNEKLKLTAAARYTTERKHVDYRFRSEWEFPSVAPRTSYEFFDFRKAVETRNYGRQLSAAAPPASYREEWDNISWKVALDYRPTDYTLLYALVSRGFKGGAFKPSANTPAELRNADGSFQSVRPEIVTDYEVGVKSDIIPGRLRVNASVFYYDYKDYQTNQLNPQTGSQILSNLPKSRLIGGEVEVEAIPVDNLFVNLGIGYTDTKITKALDPSLVGNALPFAEDLNANLTVKYDIDTAYGKISPEINIKHRGKYYPLKENQFKIGGYALVNARVNFESANGKYYGSVWGRNIGDRRESVTLDDAAEFWGTNLSYITARRTYGVTVGARF